MKKNTTVRLPTELENEIKKRAEKNERSISKEIIFMIKEFIKNNP